MSRSLKIPIHVVAIYQTREHTNFYNEKGKDEFVQGEFVESITIRLPDGKLWKLKAPHGLASALIHEWVEPAKKAVKKPARKKKS
jgi:hypothetical protein